MNHGFKTIDLNSLIESSLFSYVFHNAEIKLVLRDIGICLLDLIGLFLRAYGSDD